MLRVFFTIVVPLVLPTALYLLWVETGQRRGAHGPAGPVRWAALPWPWLAGAGALLLAIVLFAVSVSFGTRQPGVYVPPQWVNGRIVPGHIRPSERR